MDCLGGAPYERVSLALMPRHGAANRLSNPVIAHSFCQHLAPARRMVDKPLHTVTSADLSHSAPGAEQLSEPQVNCTKAHGSNPGLKRHTRSHARTIQLLPALLWRVWSGAPCGAPVPNSGDTFVGGRSHVTNDARMREISAGFSPVNASTDPQNRSIGFELGAAPLKTACPARRFLHTVEAGSKRVA